MSKETERATIFSELKNVWPSQYGAIAWPNLPFVAPTADRWAAAEILTYTTDRASLGRDFFKRTYGSLQIDLFVPDGVGTKEAREVADFLEDHFQDLKLITSDGEAIQFGTPESKTLPVNVARAENLEDNWYRYVVDCPFHRDSHVIK